MTIARERQIHLGSTSFYHCYVRCVRRAWLCGQDEQSGTNYDHRKQWLVSRLRFLSYVYAIDLCAYAAKSGAGSSFRSCLTDDDDRFNCYG